MTGVPTQDGQPARGGLVLGKLARARNKLAHDRSTPAQDRDKPGQARRGWPLSRYLAALVLLFVLASVAGAYYGWTRSRTDALATAQRDAQFGARLAARQLSQDVDLVGSNVAQVASTPNIERVFVSPAGCTLSFALTNSHDLGHLDIIGKDGSVACSSRKLDANRHRREYQNAPWLPAALHEPLIRAPVLDTVTGAKVVLVTAPLPGATGVMAGFVSLESLGPELASLYGGPRGLEFLVSTADRKTVLTSSADPKRWVGQSLAGTAFTDSGITGQHPDLTGRIKLYGSAVVDRAGWQVAAGADRASALASARQLAWRQTLIIFAGLLVALAATFLVYRRITRPIGRLSGAVRTAAGGADGGMGTPEVPLTVSGPAEVNALADEFNGLVAAVDRELTERRRAERTARELEHSYHELFDQNPYPMYVLDQDTLAVLAVNDAATVRYGYPRQEFLQLAFPQLLPDRHAPSDRSAPSNSSAPSNRSAPSTSPAPPDNGETPKDGKTPYLDGRQRHTAKDGTVIDVIVTAHPLSFGGRAARCVVIEDVTEKEQLEQRLRQTQRLESIGKLAGGVAHDFNNLLGIINGYASFVATELEQAARDQPNWLPVRDDLEQVLLAVDRGAGLTRQLLSFARQEVIQPRVVDLNELVTGVEKMLGRTLGEDVELRTSLDTGLHPVEADPGQLEQVLVNLAVNARDAMPDGGVLTIDTTNFQVDEQYAELHPGAEDGDYVRVRVSDSGTGMSAEAVERAFEPFFTTKPQGQGTGLGLATVYGIVAQAGGYTQIYSEPEMGTTITVLLPSSEKKPDSETSSTQVSGLDGQGETILVVEDEDSLRKLTERILVSRGYTVLTAADGTEALKIASSLPILDLLLTDVVMPGMQGHELAEELRTSRPGLRVVYMSGYAQPVLASRRTLPPGVTLLNKPFPMDALLQALRSALG